MGIKKLAFPIVLAIVWILMAAMAIADFASFDATTRPSRAAVAERPTKVSARPQGRQVSMLND
jgi:hypothetical protein